MTPYSAQRTSVVTPYSAQRTSDLTPLPTPITPTPIESETPAEASDVLHSERPPEEDDTGRMRTTCSCGYRGPWRDRSTDLRQMSSDAHEHEHGFACKGEWCECKLAKTA